MQQRSFFVIVKDKQLLFDDGTLLYSLDELTQENWKIICISEFIDKATRNKYSMAICRKDES